MVNLANDRDFFGYFLDNFYRGVGQWRMLPQLSSTFCPASLPVTDDRGGWLTFRICSEELAFKMHPLLGLPGWLMNHNNLFLMFLDAEKSKIKAPEDSMLDGGPSLHRHLFAVFSSNRKGQESFLRLIYTGINSIYKASALMTSQRPYLQIPPPWWLGFNLWI